MLLFFFLSPGNFVLSLLITSILQKLNIPGNPESMPYEKKTGILLFQITYFIPFTLVALGL